MFKTKILSDNKFYFILIIVLFFADQISKYFITINMQIGQSIPVWGENFFRLTYVTNEGIAFSLQVLPIFWLKIVSTFIGVFTFLYMLIIHPDNRLLKTAFAIIVGGAAGNLADRWRLGAVTDFLDFDFPDFIMTRWPVFNISDVLINVGMGLLILYLLKEAINDFRNKKKASEIPEIPE